MGGRSVDVREKAVHASSRPASPTPIGRDRDLTLLDELVGSGGGAVVVRGAAGVGKTTVLRMVEAKRGVRSLWVRGTEAEAVLPFAGAADLLLPLRTLFEGLPDVQRQALEVGLALSPGSATSPLAACVAALGVLSAAAEESPLLVLVDDFQWIDPPTRQLLLFVARRLAADAVTMVLAIRDEPGTDVDTADLPVLRLAGLHRDDCRRIVAALEVDVPADVAEQLIERSRGNPLALVESVRHVDGREMTDAEIELAAPTDGSSLDRAWRCAIESLPTPTHRALILIAAADHACLTEIIRALTVFGCSLDDLAPAEARGLVRYDGSEVQLRHPLLRPVLLGSAPVATKLAVYGALAACATGAAHAWYRAAAAAGPDDEVAALLAAAAQDARERRGHGAAARIWRKAAQLTRSPSQAISHLLDAATDALNAGDCVLAHAWSSRVVAAEPPPAVLTMAVLIRARADLWLARPDQAITDLVAAADAMLAQDAGHASVLYAEAAIPATMANRGHEAVRWAQLSEELSASSTAALCVAMALSHYGDPRAACEALARAESAGAPDDESINPQARVWASHVHVYLEDYATGRARLDVEVERARRSGASVILSAALGFRCEQGWWTGRWSAAYADATEGLAWAEELRQDHGVSFLESWLARIDAARGDDARCRERMDRAQQIAGGLAIGCIEVYVPASLGFAALTAGDLETAADHLQRAWSAALRGGLGNPNIVPVIGDLLEARVRTRDTERADEMISWLARCVDDGVYATVVRARCLGLRSTTVPEAMRHFDLARSAHARVEMPFERARTLLCEGETMRRLRRPAAARAVLREALSVFGNLGARPWVMRAAGELAAAGERPAGGPPPRTTRSPIEDLSPQEFQIGRLVADGHSNEEAAAALFLSRKTVEAHLTHAYRKLGVRSRTGLARAFLELR